ncbi:MAG: peptidoglycan-binding domain-containing protein [Clostridiaceae bacterium]
MAYYKYGSKGDDVKKLQQALTDAGYDTKGTDGIFGANTQAAVKAYQKDKGLTVDGIVGQQTLGSLYKPSTKMSTAGLPADYSSSVGTNRDWYNPDSGQTRQQYESGLTGGTIKPPATINPVTAPAVQPPVQDLSGLNNINLNPTATLPEYKSPYETQITEALNKFLSYDPNASIDVTSLPEYAGLKQQYDNAGLSNFNNQIGRLSALTGGRPSTAAVGTATAAQNQYAQDFAGTVIPSLINTEMNRRSNIYSDLADQLKTLQNLDTTNYNRNRDTVSDTGMSNGRYTQAGQMNQNTILANKAAIDAAAHYDDIQAYINTLDPADPERPYLEAERQKKIETEKATKAKDEQTAYERAIEQAKLKNDTRLTDAQISNYAADNARLAAESGNKTTDVTKMGTPEQLYSYYELLNVYSGNGPNKVYANNAYGAYENLIANKGTYIGALGQKLYDQITADVQNMMKNERTYSGESANVSAYNNILTKALSAKNNPNAAGNPALDAANIIINSSLPESEQLRLLDQLGIDLESLQ